MICLKIYFRELLSVGKITRPFDLLAKAKFFYLKCRYNPYNMGISIAPIAIVGDIYQGKEGIYAVIIPEYNDGE